MIHFSVFLVTAIFIAICTARLQVAAPFWRWSVAIAAIAMATITLILSFTLNRWFGSSPGYLQSFVVDFTLGGVAGFVGASWISVHRLLGSPGMLGDEWLSALESRYRFLTILLGGIVAIQLVTPYLERWLSSTTDVEVAGLIKLQIAPTANQSSQPSPTFPQPASSTAASDINSVQEALDTVISIAGAPSVEAVPSSAAKTLAVNCENRGLARSVCDDWDQYRDLILSGRGSEPGSTSQNAYSRLPMVLRDLAQIAFLSSKDETEFTKNLKGALDDRNSPAWGVALRDNFTFFDHMNGVLRCVETYSKTLRDLRLQLLDSHELVRALTLLASNPMRFDASRGPLTATSVILPESGNSVRSQLTRAADARGNKSRPLTQQRLEGVSSLVVRLAGTLDTEIESLRSVTQSKDVIDKARPVLNDAYRILENVIGTEIDHQQLEDAVLAADRRLSMFSNQVLSDKPDAEKINLVKKDFEDLNSRVQQFARDISDLALVPWYRAVRRVDQSLATVFERSSSELWVYGRDEYRDYEMWTWGAGPRPITSESGRECSYGGFDIFRNGLLSFLGGRTASTEPITPAKDFRVIEPLARSLQYTPYTTIAAANLFAGIGGRESGEAILTRWLDQVPRNYWEASQGGKGTGVHAADVWLSVRAFSGLNNLMEQDGRSSINEGYFQDLMADMIKSLAAAKPNVGSWYTKANCGIAGKTPLYQATAQFFYFFYMTLRLRESELNARHSYSNDGSAEIFIDNGTVDELKSFMNLPDACLSAVQQFAGEGNGLPGQGVGWRGAVGVTLAQRLARRGLSKQWAGADAGVKHPDVYQARRIFIDSESLLSQAMKIYNAEATKAEGANRGPESDVERGPLEIRLLRGQNPWLRHWMEAKTGVEALGDAAGEH